MRLRAELISSVKQSKPWGSTAIFQRWLWSQWATRRTIVSPHRSAVSLMAAFDERRLPSYCLLYTMVINATKVSDPITYHYPWYLTKEASSGINFIMFPSGIKSCIKHSKHCCFDANVCSSARFLSTGILVCQTDLVWNTGLSREIRATRSVLCSLMISGNPLRPMSVDQCTLKLRLLSSRLKAPVITKSSV